VQPGQEVQKKTGDTENKLDRITDPDGTQIYLVVFIKKDSTRSAKTRFLGRPHNLRADSDFYVVLQKCSLHGLNEVAKIYLVRLLLY